MKRDLIIIGGGAGGLVCASVAGQLGLNVTLIEKQAQLGGDCLHDGCVPSKTLIKSAQVAHTLRQAVSYGLTAQEPQVDLGKVNDHVHEVINKIQQHDDPERFRAYGCEVIHGQASFVGKNKIRVNDQELSAKRIIIATGSRPATPPIAGIENVDYLTNESVFQERQLPEHLLIIGAGAIGVEMAQAFVRLGSQVTVVDISDRILPAADPQVTALLQEQLQKEGIAFHFVKKISQVSQAKQINLRCQTKTIGEITITGDRLLVAAGRSANVDQLNLADAGVMYSSRGIQVNRKLQSSNKRIYAIGDAADSPYKFTHMAEYHAGIVISNAIFHWPKKVSQRVIPSVIYTDPELAMVGLTPAQADAKKIRYQSLCFPFAEIDRAIAVGAPAGMVKLLVSKDKIIGASLLGQHAGELLAEVTLAMQANIDISEISATIHAYPTLSQIIRRAVNSYYAPKLFSRRTKCLVKWLNKW